MAIQTTGNTRFLVKKVIKKCIQYSYAPFISWYTKADRFYTSKGLKILIKKGVFHPGFFFSTKLLITTLTQCDVKRSNLLELGAGSGLISFYCAKNGANVTATDINPTAIAGLEENKKRLAINITIIQSDLFNAIPLQVFDYIVINPPYYPKHPNNDEEKAWFCGVNFEYFEKLFNQLGAYTNPKTNVFVSLSEDCDIQKITSIANKNNFQLKEHLNKMTLWERNYIYKVVSR